MVGCGRRHRGDDGESAVTGSGLRCPRVPGQQAATLYVGFSWGGQLLEVLAVLTPPRDVFVFHAMPLRPEIAQRAGFYDEEE